MTGKPIGVLSLQGDSREHLEVLARLGVAAVGVRRVSELESVAGIIIPGGESTAMSRLLTVFDLFEPLRAAIAAGLPAFGSCAGMIMLAREVLDTRTDAVSLDALDISVRRNAFGRQVDSFEADLDVAGFDAPFRAVFIRAPQVTRVGAGVEVLATVPFAAETGEREAIVAVSTDRVLATSFHPEVTGDLRLHQRFVDMCS